MDPQDESSGEAGEVGQPSILGGIRVCLDGVWGGESDMKHANIQLQG